MVMARHRRMAHVAAGDGSLMPPADVMDYGAIGDGVVDDTEALRAALATRANVHLPAGAYAITAPMVLSAKQTVSGDGMSLTYINNTGPGPAFVFEGNEHRTLRDLGILGAAAPTSHGIGRCRGGHGQPAGTQGTDQHRSRDRRQCEGADRPEHHPRATLHRRRAGGAQGRTPDAQARPGNGGRLHEHRRRRTVSHPTGVRRVLDNAADRALATRHASVPALWTLQP